MEAGGGGRTTRRPWRPPALLLVVLSVVLLGSLMSSSEALYEDQVGVWDWHQQYIGRVKHAVFQTQGSGRKRVVVATEENAIASLNLRTGEIYWRHILGESDTIDALGLALGKYVITVSGGCTVRAWHLPDGALIWETPILSSSGSISSLLIPPFDISDNRFRELLVFGGGTLTALSAVDGGVLWRTKFPTSKELDIQKLVLQANNGKVYGVGFSGGSGLAIVEVDLLRGAMSDPKVTPTSGPLSTEEVLVTNGVAIALDAEGKYLVAAVIDADKDFTFSKTLVSSLLPGGPDHPKLLQAQLEGAILLALGDTTAIVTVDPLNGKLRVVEKLIGAVSVSDSLSVSEGKHAVAIIQLLEGGPSDNIFSLQVHSDDWTQEAKKETTKLPSQRGLLQKVFLNAYLRTDRTHGFRALVVGEDDSLSLLQQGEVVWTREDGLASIVDATTSELRLEQDGVSVSEVEHDLAEWLKGHFMRLKATLFLASTDDIAAVQQARLNQADKTKLVRDHNGFRKLLLVLTKAGKLLALHTGNGRIVWSLLIPALRTSGGLHTVPIRLLPWQVPHQHALDENPTALILAKTGSAPDSPGILSWVDAHSGKELSSVRLSYTVTQAIPLPLTDSSEQRLHLLVDDQAMAHLFPMNEESLAIFVKQKLNTFFYIVDKEKGMIEGYEIRDLDRSGGGKPGEGYLFQTAKLWSVVFPVESETIAAVATRRPDEVVHTQAKVLGNRDVLYKYLNKNLVFVATVTPRPAGAVGAATLDESSLVAYLIDTVTGRILHRVTHPNTQGPVHAVVSENWVVYHYFNLRYNRYEMSLLEIYDQSRVGDKGVLQLMLGRHNASTPVSSYSFPNIEVKGQSYFFTFTVKSMTVTTTAQGITSKQVLIGTVADQVLALDKRFLDPRRTLKPTAVETEEGIIPYTDTLPISPQAYLTHAYQVEGLRGMLTVPARLESTCLVFAYGLDLFYTRTAPSRIYDSLTEDFSYALLLITIIALLVAIVVTWVLSNRKELAEKWK